MIQPDPCLTIDFQTYKAEVIEECCLVTRDFLDENGERIGDFLNDNGEKITLVRSDWARLIERVIKARNEQMDKEGYVNDKTS